MSTSKRAPTTSAVPLPKPSSRFTRATANTLSNQRDKTAGIEKPDQTRGGELTRGNRGGQELGEWSLVEEDEDVDAFDEEFPPDADRAWVVGSSDAGSARPRTIRTPRVPLVQLPSRPMPPVELPSRLPHSSNTTMHKRLMRNGGVPGDPIQATGIRKPSEASARLIQQRSVSSNTALPTPKIDLSNTARLRATAAALPKTSPATPMRSGVPSKVKSSASGLKSPLATSKRTNQQVDKPEDKMAWSTSKAVAGVRTRRMARYGPPVAFPAETDKDPGVTMGDSSVKEEPRIRRQAIRKPPSPESNPARLLDEPRKVMVPKRGPCKRLPAELPDDHVPVDSPDARRTQRRGAVRGTPSKIPRLDTARAGLNASLLKTGSPCLSSTYKPATGIRPTPQKISFPRMAPLNDSPTSEIGPNWDMMALPSTGKQIRNRKISTASDIDDKLRQSMLRMPRMSGVSNGDSPLSILKMDSGRSAQNAEGRTIRRSPLADMSRPARFSEKSLLGAGVNSPTLDTPHRVGERPQRLNMPLAATPITQASPAELRAAKQSLEQENQWLISELMSSDVELDRIQAEKRNIVVANVWADLVAACQVELAQLERESAERRREVETFDKMVALAKLAI